MFGYIVSSKQLEPDCFNSVSASENNILSSYLTKAKLTALRGCEKGRQNGLYHNSSVSIILTLNNVAYGFRHKRNERLKRNNN